MNFKGNIRYQLTAEEIVCGWLKYRRHPKHWRTSITLIILGILMTLYSALHDQPLGLGFSSAVAFTLIAVVLCALTPWQIHRHYLKAARANEEYTEPKEMSFGDEGLMISAASGRVSFTWSKVKRITEDPQYFYLHANRVGWVMLLPKTAFDAKGEEIFRQCSQSVPRV